MGELRPILWARQSTNDRSGKATCERLLNCYLQPNPPGSAQPFKIIGTPGLKLFGTFGTGPIRGAIYVSQLDRLFVVSGNELYVVSSDASSTMIGVIPGGGLVSLCNNQTQIAITTNLGLYVATLVSVTQATDGSGNPDVNYYTSATYQDGYGIFTKHDTDEFYISNIDDMTVIDPLDFSTADTFADNGKGCVSDHRELLVFGADTIEAYSNTGNAYFPFERIPGNFHELGCKSGASISKALNRVFWHCSDGGIWQIAGNQPEKISTPGIDEWIRSRTTPDESSSFVYGQDGAMFYGLNWSNGTIVYDISTGLWHERESYEKMRWRADVVVRAFGQDLAGDYETGNIYVIDLSTHGEETIAGTHQPIVVSMQPPPIDGGGNRVSMTEIILDCEMGTIADPTADPQWVLKWSDDGGKTWSSEVWRTAGLSGEYMRQARWNGLGQCRRRTYQLSNSDVMSRTILGAWGRWDVLNG